MTLAAIRTAIRNFCKEASTDVGTLFPADNIYLDFFINSACDFVILDLARDIPSYFLSYEDISLVSGTQSYTLTKEWLQLWTINRNVTGQYPQPLTYIPWTSQLYAEYSGQTQEEPDAYTLAGAAIYFLPKPSVAKTGYARVWVIEPELATIGTSGPTKIPRLAQQLIPLMAMTQIATMLEASAETWVKLYGTLLKKVIDVLGYPIQGQPRTIGESFKDKVLYDARDRTTFDRIGFFDR